jgi:glycerophosphoryl diester phosphodiesterase
MHKPFLSRYKQAWNNLHKKVKPVVGFEVWFSLIYAVVLAPFTAWLLNKLLVPGGQLAVSNEDIITFFLSPLGILFILLSIAFFLGLTFLEQVGLMVISFATVEGRVLSASSALWESLAHFLPIIRLGLLQAMLYVAASLPFLAAGALTYISFLGAMVGCPCD